MKKFKYLILLPVFIMCLCFSLTGCSHGKLKYGSFTYSTEASYSGENMHVNCSFEFKVPSDGDYTVDYRLVIKDGNGKQVKAASHHQSFPDCKQDGTYNLKSSETVYDYDKTDLTAELTYVNISKDKKPEEFIGYAIGLGVVGALLLGGVITAFVLGNRKEK